MSVSLPSDTVVDLTRMLIVCMRCAAAVCYRVVPHEFYCPWQNKFLRVLLLNFYKYLYNILQRCMVAVAILYDVQACRDYLEVCWRKGN